MGDPHRLRSESGTLAALLLRSSPTLEPPPSAEEEVWRKLEVISSVGAAAGVAGIASQTAATVTPEIVGKTIWMSLLKWSAVVALGVPTVGIGASWISHRDVPVTAADGQKSAVRLPANVGVEVNSVPVDPARTIVSADRVAPDVPKTAPRLRPGVPGALGALGTGHPGLTSADAPSALKAESAMLGVARAKLASGDMRGALDDVAQLDAQFPHGRLVQEREVVAIDSLAALGDREGAQARAIAFLKRFADSPYEAHLRQLVGR
jgi:hypothetical protein